MLADAGAILVHAWPCIVAFYLATWHVCTWPGAYRVEAGAC